MKEIRGQRLYVRLGASQTRRRLKGHGFGVRKVGATGTNESVIIHTATGQHQRDLEALFADVRFPEPAPRPEATLDHPIDESVSGTVERNDAGDAPST